MGPGGFPGSPLFFSTSVAVAGSGPASVRPTPPGISWRYQSAFARSGHRPLAGFGGSGARPAGPRLCEMHPDRVGLISRCGAFSLSMQARRSTGFYGGGAGSSWPTSGRGSAPSSPRTSAATYRRPKHGASFPATHGRTRYARRLGRLGKRVASMAKRRGRRRKPGGVCARPFARHGKPLNFTNKGFSRGRRADSAGLPRIDRFPATVVQRR